MALDRTHDAVIYRRGERNICVRVEGDFSMKRKSAGKRRIAILVSMTTVILGMTIGQAAASSTTLVVDGGHAHDWTFVQQGTCGAGDTGSQGFVTGPGTPPTGTGSLEMSVGSDGDSFQGLGTTGLDGTKLADLTKLSYSTYVSTPSTGGGDQQAPYMNIRLDYDGDNVPDDRFFFEPTYSSGTYSGDPVAPQPAITDNTWQTWDALNGGWWSENDGFGGPPVHTLQNIAADHPGATIVNGPNAGLKINVGCGGGAWQSFVGNFDNVTVGVNSADTTFDFEPTVQCTAVCYVDAAAGNDANGGASIADAKKTIQAAINQVDAGGQVRVLPGIYNESAPGSNPTSLLGTYQFGLFFGSAKPGITLMGVNGSDVPITNPASTAIRINTDATNNFGTDGIFVEAADTTIQGVEIGPNLTGDNKTIEVVADNFTLQNANTDIPNGGGSIYINDFSAGGTVVKSYHVLGNLFDDGTSVDISSGAGNTGPVSGREILNNTFDLMDNGFNGVSFNGTSTPDIPWFANPVGGAIIKGNSFSNSTQYIRARGVYAESEFDWKSYWDDNTYDRAAVALVTESPFDVRSYAYSVFTNVRRIGGTIQGEVDHTVAGDTVLVKPGVYPEHVTLGQMLTLKGANAGTPGNGARGPESKITGDSSGAVQVTGNRVTVDGFKVQSALNNLGTGIHMSSGQTGALITNNLITGNQMGIYANSAGASTISYNLFDANNEAGAAGGSGIYSEFTDHMTIDHNEFKNHTTNNPIIFGATGANVHKNLTVSNNYIHDNVSGIYVLGVKDGSFTGNDISAPGATALSFAAGGNTNIMVTKNLLHDSARGVRFQDFGDLPSAGLDNNITVTKNSITGNSSYGIGNISGYTGSVDATCNWYGSGTGPTNVGNPGGTGDTVTGSVTYYPWLFSSNLNASCSSATGGFTFLGYQSPLPKTKLSAAANSTIPVKFRLGDSSGTPLPASIASTLVTRVVLSGPEPAYTGLLLPLTTVKPCPYNITSGVFKCNLAKPRTVTIGAQWYWITTTVQVGTSTYVLPVNFGVAVNPEQVTFKK